MRKRHADVDLPEDSDSETQEWQECVPAEDRVWGISGWIFMMTKIIIGAYQWWRQNTGDTVMPAEWAKTIKPDQLKFLRRRDAVMPALDSDHVLQLQQWWSTVTPESLQLQMANRFADASAPPWEPKEDYTLFFMQSKLTTSAHAVGLLAVAELRWLASGGILSMASNTSIRQYCRRREMVCSIPEDADFHARTRAARVDSIPPTKECMDLLDCLEGWNNHQLPDELGNRTGGSTKPLTERQLTKELLSVVVEYTVSNCRQLVLTSTCEHVQTHCHFGSTRRWWICADDQMSDILYSFMYLNPQQFALIVTDTRGQPIDCTDVLWLQARKFPVVGDREVHLHVQAKLDYFHNCVECDKRFRCVPEGGYFEPRFPPPDNTFGCECHHFDEDLLCSNDCYHKRFEER
jgi:hypothetical protein